MLSKVGVDKDIGKKVICYPSRGFVAIDIV